MGSPTIFSGRRTKLLTADGLLTSAGQTIDYDGQVNYIKNGNAEVNVNGWVAYADSGSRPVNGIDGSPTITITRTTSSPLRGVGSFLISKTTGVSTQGQGVSYDFTIDSADQAKVLNISFDYSVASGTYSGGTSSTDSDLIVYIYDVTNARLIEPAPIKMDGSVIGVQYKYVGSFQTSSNSTSYRLIIHTATSNTQNYTFEFDNVKVSPSVVTTGAYISDTKSSTPSYTNLGFTPSTNVVRYYRSGDRLFVDGVTLFSSGTGSASTLILTLPESLQLDTTKLNTTDSTQMFGSWSWYDDAGSTTTLDDNWGPVVYNTTTSVKFRIPNDTNAFVTSVMAANDRSTYSFSVPIAGWGTSQVLSSETDTRVVAFDASVPTSTHTATTSKVTGWTRNLDTHTAFDATNNRYIAPIAGNYSVTATMAISNTALATTVFIYKNGSQYRKSSAYSNGAINASPNCDVILRLNAGDYIEVFFQTSSATATAVDTSICSWSIERLSGPSQIAASESVNARYTNTAGTAFSASVEANLPFATRDYDSHNAFSTDTYTIPVSGKYRVTAAVRLASAVYNGNGIALFIRKNGANVSRLGVFIGGSASSLSYGLNGSDTINCNAGDTLVFRFISDVANTLSTTAGDVHMAIERVGN